MTGSRCEASADSPIAAATEVSASSTGTAAASSAPNVDDQDDQRDRQAEHLGLPEVALVCVFCSALSIVAPPTCSTRRSGYAAWTAAVASSSGPTWSAASCGVAGHLRPDQHRRRRRATSIGPVSCATSGRPRQPAGRPRPPRRPPLPGPAAPARLVIRTFSTAGIGEAAVLQMRSARPHSPTAASASDCERVPAMPPTATHSATNATQPSTARQRCSALHRATRTTRARGACCTRSPLPPPAARQRPRPAPSSLPARRSPGLCREHPYSAVGLCPTPSRPAGRMGSVGARPYGGVPTDARWRAAPDQDRGTVAARTEDTVTAQAERADGVADSEPRRPARRAARAGQRGRLADHDPPAARHVGRPRGLRPHGRCCWPCRSGSLPVFLVGVPLLGVHAVADPLMARLERGPLPAGARRGHPRLAAAAAARRRAGPAPHPDGTPAAGWREVGYLLLRLPLGIVQFALTVAFWSVPDRAAHAADLQLGAAATAGPRSASASRSGPGGRPRWSACSASCCWCCRRGWCAGSASPTSPSPAGCSGRAGSWPPGSASWSAAGPGWSTPPSRSAAGSSATCTTAPSSGWSRWR